MKVCLKEVQTYGRRPPLPPFPFPPQHTPSYLGAQDWIGIDIFLMFPCKIFQGLLERGHEPRDVLDVFLL